MQHRTDHPDVVYVLRESDSLELRYSLRSLTNLPHNTVWTFGGQPPWVTNTRHVHVPQGGSKHINSARNLRAAVYHPDVADDFYLFNDDFFILEPITDFPTLHRGHLTDVLQWYKDRYPNWENTYQNGFYTRGMNNTLHLLQNLGHHHPYSYELHTPLLINKKKARRVFERLDKYIDKGITTRPLHWRTIYGNLTRQGGTATQDVKVYRRRDHLPEGPFASTTDNNFRQGIPGRQLRAMFPEPSPYEGKPPRRHHLKQTPWG